MNDDGATAAERLLESLVDAPLGAWYAAALQAEADAEVPDPATLWQSAYEADPVLMWSLADKLETLFFRLESPFALELIGGRNGSRHLRVATESVVVSMAFPGLVTAEQMAALSKPFLELLTRA